MRPPLLWQSHVERYFRDIAQVTDVVAMEVAVSNALAWDLVGCTPFDPWKGRFFACV